MNFDISTHLHSVDRDSSTYYGDGFDDSSMMKLIDECYPAHERVTAQGSLNKTNQWGV